ncbi:SDR family oxidoreductase [Microbacterium deminutum]|uniref:SDR family oxidoreductase n=1 Tax=Microbacterium deminutum TaxID=344164 RepID=A0ABP5BPC8_9MICO
MARTALITGASSGLGAEFARQLAERGADLILVARDEDALESVATSLRGRYGIGVQVLAADLTEPEQREKVVERLEDDERPIEILVNNAGYGLPLAFERNDIEEEARHLALHVEAPMRLAHAALGPMLTRGGGRIINVASVAGFIPRGTYGAVKGWVISFSRWANVRYGPRGVTVTAVCPGFVHTGFHERLGLPPGDEGVPRLMWLNAPDVVRAALRDAARGRAVSIPSLRYKLLIALTRVVPASIVVKAGETGR